jgi:O-glycosyl hydrolase
MAGKFNIRNIILCTVIFTAGPSCAQTADKTVIEFDPSKTYQAIDNFGASDAWSCQFVGNWPDEKKNAIADLLFSTDTLKNGSPKGIGLSLWRYNIGAGSANQGMNSGIKDEWRRAASFMNDSNGAMDRIKAQNWFLTAARKRGVKQFLGFFNSPPVYLTINGRTFATKGATNIKAGHYKDFANYSVDAINQIKKATGISFNYLSPVNEPQWDWSDDKQEGCPYTNAEITQLVKILDEVITKNKLATKIILPESGHLKYLSKAEDKQDKDEQISTFFNASSTEYIGNLSTVYNSIASHSYFSTSPYKDAIALRKQIADSISKIEGLKFWQSEYCILGDNDGEINGSKRDLGIDAALYVAKVIHEDLVWANASAWQWWLAISPYNYKDGLIYIDKKETDGNYYDSKMLWALGNYSAFIRPGMKRIETSSADKDLLVSAYRDNDKLVIVFVNPSGDNKTVSLTKQNAAIPGSKKLITYTTNATNNLKKNIVTTSDLIIPAKSIVSVIVN